MPVAFTEAASSEAVESGLSFFGDRGDGDRTLVNLTIRRLEITDPHGTIVIAPLGSRRLEKSRADQLELGKLIDAGYLSVVIEPPKVPIGTSVASAAGVLAVATYGVYVGFEWLDALVAAAIGIVALGLFAALGSKERRQATLGYAREFPLRVKSFLSLLLVVAIVFVLPGAILFFGSDVPHLIDVAQAKGNRKTSDAATAILIGIGMQVIFIAIAASLPGLLYFLFDREKLRTLRERFTRQIFRLDPSVTTVGEVNAKYEKLINEAYGRERGTERLLPGRRFPIVIATALITLGWILTLLEPHLAEKVADTSLVSLFTPVPNAVVYAFLGAYFFSLHHLLRGFMRGDLRPKSYAHVSVRILSVTVLAFVLSKATAAGSAGVNGRDEGVLLVLAFMTGVLPETTLLRFQEISRGLLKSRRPNATTVENHPLTHLEGIDIYDRARLTDEGVTNVEGLAHHDVVDLLLKTRIPVPRLVDWVDQAILYIHAAGGSIDGTITPKATLDRLRCYGIRTATDLEETYRAAKKNNREAEFLRILPTPANGPAEPTRIRVMLDAIADEEWMHNLRHWHRQGAAAGVIRYPADFQHARP